MKESVGRPGFHVAQRVVCVDASANPKHGAKMLSRGKIYIVRAIDQTPRRWEPPGWGVHVEGITIAHPSGKFEWTMRPGRFRAVVDRPTSIEIFKKLLAGAGAGVPPPAPKKPAQLRLPFAELALEGECDEPPAEKIAQPLQLRLPL
jgi:hypothetical protein